MQFGFSIPVVAFLFTITLPALAAEPSDRVELNDGVFRPSPDPQITPAKIDTSACRLPAYPAEAKAAKESGMVAVAFLVGPDGHAKGSKVAHAQGFMHTTAG